MGGGLGRGLRCVGEDFGRLGWLEEERWVGLWFGLDLRLESRRGGGVGLLGGLRSRGGKSCGEFEGLVW